MIIQCVLCNKEYDSDYEKLPQFTFKKIGRKFGLVCSNCIEKENTAKQNKDKNGKNK